MTKNSKRILSLVIFLFAVIFAPVYYVFFFPEDGFKSLSSAKEINDSWSEDDYSEFKTLGLTKASEYIISTSDQKASEVGARILEKGGNAIDAVVGAQMVLNVVEPQSSGIGGGAFLLYYDAKTGETKYYNGRETAPLSANSEIFLDKNREPKSFHDAVKGGLSVGTPGLLKMLKQVHEERGNLPWDELFVDAIKIAKEGFLMNERIYEVATDLSYLADFNDFSKIYLKDDRTPKAVGSIIKNPDLAKTFEKIAKHGVDIFYKGEIADNIVKKVQNSKINPGFLSKVDLVNYEVLDGELVCGPYRKYKICSMGIPSSGGITLLQALGILENFNLADYTPSSVGTINLIAQATQLAYLDRDKYIADVDGVPVKEMLDKKYLKSRSKLIDEKKIIEVLRAGEFKLSSNYIVNHNTLENPSTTHLSVVDKEGNAISMTSSIEYLFGSALVANGFVLNNQLTDFSFVPEINGVEVANKVSPGKQPRSSMTPTFVFDENDKLILVVGSPGGKRIIQYVLKTLIAHLDWKLNIARSIALPNFTVFDNTIEIEQGTDLEKIEADLIGLGYRVKVRKIQSGINAVAIDPHTKELIGSADFRRNGASIGK